MSPGDCEVLLDRVMTSTVSGTEAITEYFRDFTFQLGYIEDVLDLK